MLIRSEKRGVLLIIFLFFFYIYNTNATLPEIKDFNAEIYGEYGNDVKLECSYTASGACTPDWQCSDWTSCASNQKTRTCDDIRNCDPNNDQRTETQSCTA